MGLFDFLRGGVSKERFAERVMNRLKERGYDIPLRFDREKFELIGDNGAVTYLGALYEEWLSYPASERRAALDRAFDFMLEMDVDRSWEAARDRLLPVIRNRAQMSMHRLTSTGQAEHPGASPIAEHLELQIADDQPRSIALVDGGTFKSWGRPRDEVVQIAIENLRAKSPCRFDLQKGGFYISAFEDYYDASRLLLPHLFEMLDLRGAPVAVAVSRSCLTVAGRDDAAGLAAMARFAEASVDDETRPISYAPVILQEGVWRPLAPTPEDPPELQRLFVKQQLWDYACQTEALEAHFGEIGRDVYVPPLEVVDDSGRGSTWTSWTENVPALLPKAELLGLTSADGRSLVRLWSDVEAVCGAFEQDQDAYPPRFLSHPWPSDGQWARLEADHAHPPWFPAASPTGPARLAKT